MNKPFSMTRLASSLILACCATLAAAAQANAPAAAAQAVPPPPPQINVPQRAPLNPNLPTIFVVGDSTASNGPDLGWGSHLGNYFDLTKVNVANRAIAGRSSRSYMDEGHWDSTLAEIKAGDYVLLQWGQNDGGDMGGEGSKNARGDLRGDGDATQDLMQTTGPMSGKVETLHTYGWYNRKYVADTLAKGATPMFLTMTIHNSFKPDANGVPRKVTPDMRFGPVMWNIANQNHLAFIDMAAVEATRLEAMGPELVVEAALPQGLGAFQFGGRGTECKRRGDRTGDCPLASAEVFEGSGCNTARCCDGLQSFRDCDGCRSSGSERAGAGTVSCSGGRPSNGTGTVNRQVL